MSDDPKTTEIPPGERRELRSVVRSQFRVLRSEVTQRQAELAAEAETRLRAKYADTDARTAELNKKLRSLALSTQVKVDKLIDASGIGRDDQSYTRPGKVSINDVYPRYTGKRDKLKAAFQEAVRAQAKTTLLALDRQEADLLRGLAVEGIKTDQGRALLGEISTTIEALMPSERLAEIESAFDRGRA